MKAPAAQHLNFPWVTLGVCATSSLLQWLGSEHLIGLLEYRRSSVFAGELWRLWTCHLVHYSNAQSLLDIGMTMICGTCVERKLKPSTMFCFVFLVSLAISLLLLAFDPGLQRYRGLSAMTAAFAAFALRRRWREHPEDHPWILIAAILFALQIVAVACGLPADLRTLPPQIVVAWQAHLFGVLVAILAESLDMKRQSTNGLCAAATTSRAAARTRCD